MSAAVSKIDIGVIGDTTAQNLPEIDNLKKCGTRYKENVICLPNIQCFYQPAIQTPSLPQKYPKTKQPPSETQKYEYISSTLA